MSEGSMNILFLLLLLVTRRRTEERGRRIRPVCHVCIYPVGGWKEKSLIAEGDKVTVTFPDTHWPDLKS
jgi:hypothetical protein